MEILIAVGIPSLLWVASFPRLGSWTMERLE